MPSLQIAAISHSSGGYKSKMERLTDPVLEVTIKPDRPFGYVLTW
jgi:hypothetical protein